MPTEKRVFLTNRQRFIIDVVRYYQRNYALENNLIVERCKFLRSTRQYNTAKMVGFEDIRFAASIPGKIERAMLGTINNPNFLSKYFKKNEQGKSLILKRIFANNEIGDPSFNYQESPFLRTEKELLWFIKTFPQYRIPQKI